MTTVELRLERVAHGGYVVGHADGTVLFVTGGLPGGVSVLRRGKKTLAGLFVG